ncbi:hypothetical protein [Desulfobacula sp.]|uniref:hypothetical protein n=1 Tax=Desulfobacula sp. TaxID=2593537 RepID=UPI002630AAC3|nr:hypothetical protein [Desulfobacula sp.]
MTQDIQTLELAKLYERQGYVKEALETYTVLDDREPSIETRAGLDRMEKRMEKKEPSVSPDSPLSQVFEKWVKLLVLQHRVDTMKKMAAQRLSV